MVKTKVRESFRVRIAIKVRIIVTEREGTWALFAPSHFNENSSAVEHAGSYTCLKFV